MNLLWDRLAQRAAETGRPLHETARHHLLEGILRRLTRLPQPDRFILRGGLVTRLWVGAAARPTQDIDLVGTFAYDLDETVRLLAPLLHDPGPADGLCFDPDGFHAEPVWQETEFPGVRFFLRVGLGEPAEHVQIDVGFGDPLVPPAQEVDFPTLLGDAVRVWCARPETMVAWKLHGLFEMGERRWRAKDLHDLLLITQGVPLQLAGLVPAIAVAFTSRNATVEDARTILAAPWWQMKKAQGRWADFRHSAEGLSIPEDLSGVVARVAQRLQPALVLLQREAPGSFRLP
jgi:hypothetical protein